MSFIDASDLAQVAAMVVEAADSPVDWYQMQGNFAMNADVIRSSTPVELRALVLNGILEEYNAQGYQRIRTRDYYFPGAPAIDPLDQIMLSGENSPLCIDIEDSPNRAAADDRNRRSNARTNGARLMVERRAFERVALADAATGNPLTATDNGDGTSTLSVDTSSQPAPTNFALETGGNLAASKTDLDAVSAHLAGHSGLNITDTADHLLHSGAAVLRLVSLNTAALTSTLKVYNGTTAGGTLLCTLDGTTVPRAIEFDIACSVGVFAKATGTADWTVTWE